jgi:hypothetical protein
MFINRNGQISIDTERIAERAASLSDAEIARFEERQGILRDVMNSFEARLSDLPERERRAMLCLLYDEIADKVFDFRISLEARLARQAIHAAPTHAEKIALVSAFGTTMADIEAIHGKQPH